MLNRTIILSLLLSILIAITSSAQDSIAIDDIVPINIDTYSDSLHQQCTSDSIITDTIAIDTLATDSAGVAERIGYLLFLASNKEPDRSASIMYIPIIFTEYHNLVNPLEISASKSADSEARFTVDDEWLTNSMKKTAFENYQMTYIINNRPDIVKYNLAMLPEPPKQYVITSTPGTLTLSLEERAKNETPSEAPPKTEIKIKNWITSFNASVQFSQAYLSDNWYQGGNSNLNLFGNFVLNVNLNPTAHPDLLFENTFQYKIGLASAPQDSLRSYSINEDLFQINSKFGIKAIKKWYYTATLQFKTQVFNNFKTNTNDLTAAFLSPGELNIGLGMTYSTTNKKKTANFNVSIAPVSYNMKICREIDKIDPTNFGIKEGRHLSHQVGSNLEAKLSWNITHNISFTSRFYVFTNYDYLQGDWENSFNFSINKYLSSQFYFHLRYDSSADSDPDWKKWQFKEILSFGFNYKI